MAHVHRRGGRLWTAADLPRGVRAQRAHKPLFDAATTSADDLQKSLKDGRLKSTEIVEEFIWRVQEHNSWLNAVWELAPGCMEQAERADHERNKNATSLGPLHGIPIWIKDNVAIHPSLGMGTTAGAVALQGSTPRAHSPLVQLLLSAGAIIIGRTTLSELSFHKGIGIPCGWSALAGQGQSPYVRGGYDYSDQSVVGHSSPGGSSSGSAIAVAAGLGVLAIGSETEGSLVVPSTRAALYTIKPSIGLVSQEGIAPISHYMDTAGPIARSATDMAHLLDAIVAPEEPGRPEGGYAASLKKSWDGLRVGVVDPEVWQYPAGVVKPEKSATEQIIRETRKAYSFLEKHATSFHENVTLRPHTDFEINGASVFPLLMDAHFEADFDKYLAGLDVTKVRTLKELIDFNKRSPKIALAEYQNQDHLINGIDFNKQDKVEGWNELMNSVGKSLGDTLEKYQIDVIIGPGDSFLTNYAAANQSPVGTLPMAYLDLNGRPIGLQVLAARHREDLIIRVQSAWEASWFSRQPPLEYLKHSGQDGVKSEL